MVSPAGAEFRVTTSHKTIGVLALQGDFARHAEAWTRAGAIAREVRTAEAFEGLDALSMPGGESTTMLRLLGVTGLRPALERAVARLPVFATCAGAILLARQAERLPAPTLGAIDFDVLRNAYGTQVDSFEADVEVPVLGDGGGDGSAFRGVFIRAPRFGRLGPGVETIARLGDEAVGVRQGRLVALAFHPELTDDARLHRWFLERVVSASGARDAAGAVSRPRAETR
jgi:5'-phosphate synthase pdxT subunit